MVAGGSVSPAEISVGARSTVAAKTHLEDSRYMIASVFNDDEAENTFRCILEGNRSYFIV